MDYVRNKCTKNVEHRTKLMMDYEKPIALTEFRAVGILSRMLSAPWMSRFYRDVDSSFTYVEAFRQIQGVIDKLKAISTDDALDVGSFTEDLFGDPLNKSQDRMWDVSTDPSVSALFRELATVCVTVLERQYKDMLCLSSTELEDLTKATGVLFYFATLQCIWK